MRGAENEAIELIGSDLDSAADCTVTIAADPEHGWVIDEIHYGISEDATTVALISVTFGGVAKFKTYAKSTGNHPIRFRKGLYTGTKNEAVVVTASDPAGTATAQLNVLYH